jgi:hypothetical protein
MINPSDLSIYPDKLNFAVDSYFRGKMVVKARIIGAIAGDFHNMVQPTSIPEAQNRCYRVC